jgi:DNA-binding response OmpR family regulator
MGARDGVERRKQILVADGNPEWRRRITETLASRGFACEAVSTARAALEAAAREPPDLLILDLFLSDQSGLGLCRMLRDDARTRRVPVMVVSAQASEIDRILAFEAGADDFLPKPFFPAELAARASAVMRGFEGHRETAVDLDEPPLRLDLERGRAEVRGERIELTPTELSILALLVQREGRVVRRRELIEELWGADACPSDRVVDAHIKSIRRKLGRARECLETVRGVGYRLSRAPHP